MKPLYLALSGGGAHAAAHCGVLRGLAREGIPVAGVAGVNHLEVVRQFPEVGLYLTTVVLAVITINQVVGPIAFKMALKLVGEVGRR